MRVRLWLGLVAASALIVDVAANHRSNHRAPDAPTFLPASDQEILEKLNLLPGDLRAQQIKALKAEVARDPLAIAPVLELAKSYIEVGRQTSDPRYNGYAEAALAPWLARADPPPAALLLRATIRQSSHDFPGALDDLDRVLRATPSDAQAWLTRAVILRVRGEFEPARQSCAPLARLASDLIAALCSGGIDALNGRARGALGAIKRQLAEAQHPSPGENLWALTELAEIAERLGDATAAELWFKEGLAAGRDVYLLGAYSDFLLDQGRPAEVVALLKDQTQADGLLLRLTLAERALKSPEAAPHQAVLTARFDAARLRQEVIHRREESRFMNALRGAPAEALRLARENWEVQKEPADARIYLEAAVSAEDPAAAAPILAWIESNKLEDVRLLALEKKLRGAR